MTELVGRSDELETLSSLFDKGARLVTITGAAGMGKTKLARHWSADKGLFVDATEARSAEDVYALVAQVLEVRDPEKLTAAVHDLDEQVLLIDNFEQLVPEASRVFGPWLQASESRFLVTSRERLHLDQETVLDLGPLALPKATDLDAPSVELFVSRARRLRSSLEIARDDREAVAEIVRILDGIPLALELAAPRLALLGPQVLRTKLRESLGVIEGSERKLQAAIAWSWELLDDAERDIACSVFRGGFEVEAAEAVVHSSTDMFEMLQALYDKSMLWSDGAGRFGMYRSLRELGAGHLAKHAQVADLRARHAEYYASLGKRLAEALNGADGKHAWKQLSLEMDNLRQATDHAPTEAVLVQAALALASAMTTRGVRKADMERVARALDTESEHSAELYLTRARVHLVAGKLDAASADLDEAQQRAKGDTRVEAFIAYVRATVAFYRGDVARSEALVRGYALPLSRQAGDLICEAGALCVLGDVLATTGKMKEGRQALEDALVGYRRAESFRDEALTLSALGSVMLELDQVDEALLACAQAESMFGELEDITGATYASLYRGLAMLVRAQWAEAESAIVASQQLARRCHNPRYEGVALGYLGLIAELSSGDLEKAHELYHQAQALLEAGQDARYGALFRGYAAAAAARRGDKSAAQTMVQARTDMTATGDAGLTRAVEVLYEHLESQPPSTKWIQEQVQQASSLDERLALRTFAGQPKIKKRVAIEESTLLRLGVDARCSCFRPPTSAEVVDIGSRRTLRRILAALVEARRERPGEHVPADTLIAATWPQEKLPIRVATNRLRVSIATLRKLGLQDTIVSSKGAYAIHPGVTIADLDSETEL